MRSHIILTILVAGILPARAAEIARKLNANTGAAAADYLESVRSAVPPLATGAGEWHATRDFKDDGGSVDLWVAEVRSPLFYRNLSQGVKIAFGLDFSVANLDISGDDIAWDGQLYGLYAPISYSSRLAGSPWFFLAQVAPGLRTDFQRITSDDFAFRAFAAAMREINPSLVCGVGAYVSYDVDTTFIVPGIGFTWKPANHWLVSLIPPQFTISYEPNDDWMFSTYFRPRSFVAALHDGDGSPDIAKTSYGKVAVSVKRRLLDSPHLWLNLNAGFTAYGNVELQRRGQVLLDEDLNTGFFAGAAVEVLGW